MNVFVTSSNEKYSRSREFSSWCAIKFAHFDKVRVYDNDKDIDEIFKEKCKEILSIPIGAGLWLWKVYIIHKALISECDEGDVLFYLDAGGFFFRNINPIVASMKDDIFAVQLPYIEEEFTKSETFDLMGGHNEDFRKTNQFQASYMGFRKTKRSVSFVEEWLRYAMDINVISPLHCFDELIQNPNFYNHRMDQSIFSLLCKKYEVLPSGEITQFALFKYPILKNQTYVICKKWDRLPVSIYLHRKANFPSFVEVLKLIKCISLCIISMLFEKFGFYLVREK